MNPVISGQNFKKRLSQSFASIAENRWKSKKLTFYSENIKKYKSFMKCQNLIDFSERKVYATKKERKSRNRRGYR